MNRKLLQLGGDPRRLIDEQALAALLDVSVKTVRKWRLNGGGARIPFCKIGRLVRYDMADVEAVLARSRRNSTTDPGGEQP